MRKVKDNFEWCAKHATSSDTSENVGLCALHSTGLGCSSSANGHFANFFLAEQMDVSAELDFVSQLPYFNQSITISPLETPEAFRKIRM